MRSDHPENCDIMYELMFNGMVLPDLVSETEISQGELIRAGFPFCRSTTVSVAPHVSAHGVIGNLTKATTYLATPSKRDNIIYKAVCMHAYLYINVDFSGPNIVRSIPNFIYKSAESTELQVAFNWDPVPPGVRYTILYPFLE